MTHLAQPMFPQAAAGWLVKRTRQETPRRLARSLAGMSEPAVLK